MKLTRILALLAIVGFLAIGCGGGDTDPVAAEPTAAPQEEPTVAPEPDPTVAPEPEPEPTVAAEPEPEPEPQPGGTSVDFSDEELIEEGKPFFEINCARCHSSDGAGSPTGPNIMGVADSQPDPLIHVALVANGGERMPAFGDELTPLEIDAVVAYARAFPAA